MSLTPSRLFVLVKHWLRVHWQSLLYPHPSVLRLDSEIALADVVATFKIATFLRELTNEFGLVSVFEEFVSSVRERMHEVQLNDRMGDGNFQIDMTNLAEAAAATGTDTTGSAQ